MIEERLVLILRNWIEYSVRSRNETSTTPCLRAKIKSRGPVRIHSSLHEAVKLRELSRRSSSLCHPTRVRLSARRTLAGNIVHV